MVFSQSLYVLVSEESSLQWLPAILEASVDVVVEKAEGAKGAEGAGHEVHEAEVKGWVSAGHDARGAK